ncbi:hypothetical protein Pcinc_004295 [Petrolisthes cinctipes]|uniref:Uncharacterized protein n=1 Tax=Petrolisthes cinctipes TaxID=88211 RepID=A0AAE1GFK0_PETCI|nr:hypothetical protein Pcinc_004295 [Petrolisthes cinctipes]
MEETRRHDEIRRHREEQEKREIEEIRRQEELLRRDEENERFTALMTLLASPRHAPAPAGPAQPSSTSVHGGDGDTDSTGTPAPTLPPPQKAAAQTPPPLKPDATIQMFREWRRRGRGKPDLAISNRHFNMLHYHIQPFQGRNSFQ